MLKKMHGDKGFDAAKLRGLHFDVLMAVTARTDDARLITTNRDSFELFGDYCEFALEVW